MTLEQTHLSLYPGDFLSEPKNHLPCFSVFLGTLNLRPTPSNEVCSSHVGAAVGLSEVM